MPLDALVTIFHGGDNGRTVLPNAQVGNVATLTCRPRTSILRSGVRWCPSLAALLQSGPHGRCVCCPLWLGRAERHAGDDDRVSHPLGVGVGPARDASENRARSGRDQGENRRHPPRGRGRDVAGKCVGPVRRERATAMYWYAGCDNSIYLSIAPGACLIGDLLHLCVARRCVGRSQAALVPGGAQRKGSGTRMHAAHTECMPRHSRA